MVRSIATIGAAAVLMHKADAGLGEMRENLLKKVNVTGASGPLRSLTGHLLQEYFMPYGCWCHFDGDQYNKVGTGHGKAMDDWDTNCRRLQEGYECAMMDADERGEPCVPWEEPYEIAGAGMTESIIERYCTDLASSTTCGAHACIVESHFVNRIADFIIPGQQAGFANLDKVNGDYLHSNNFDFAGQCQVPTPSGGGGGGGGGNPHKEPAPAETKQCCGAYPERFPYKVSAKSCCSSVATNEGKTYDSTTHVCCDDGSTTAIGNDC